MTILQGLGQRVASNWTLYSIKEQTHVLTTLAKSSSEFAAEFVQSIDSDQLKLRLAVQLVKYDEAYFPHPVLGIIKQLADQKLKKSICEKVFEDPSYKNISTTIQLYLEVNLIEEACLQAMDTLTESEFRTIVRLPILAGKIKSLTTESLYNEALFDEVAPAIRVYLNSDPFKIQACLKLIELNQNRKERNLLNEHIVDIAKGMESDVIVLELYEEFKKIDIDLAIKVLGTVKNEELRLEHIKKAFKDEKFYFYFTHLAEIAKKLKDEQVRYEICCFLIEEIKSECVVNIALTIKSDDLKFKLCESLVKIGEGNCITTLCLCENFKDDVVKFKFCQLLITADLKEKAKRYAEKWQEDVKFTHNRLMAGYQSIALKAIITMSEDDKEKICELIINTVSDEEVYDPVWSSGTALIVDIVSKFNEELKVKWCRLLIDRKKEFYANMLAQNIDDDQTKFEVCRWLVKTKERNKMYKIAKSFKDAEYRLKLVMLLIMSTNFLPAIKSVASTIEDKILRTTLEEKLSKIKHKFKSSEWVLKKK